jgi:hypothetical protein
MAGNLTAMIASIFSGGVTPDPYYEYTTLLLPGNGTNGAQNNTFLDGSTNNFTITRNGNTTQGTFSPFSQTGWGGAFNTSTTYLTVTDTANLRFGSSNFTIEAWVYRSASGATQTIASKGAATPTGWVFQISSADKLVFTDTSTSITGTTSIAANTWTYVAVVRAGTGTNQTTLYVNGTSDGTGTSATNFNQTSNMLVGADRSTTNFANGYISNLRLSNTNRTISSTPTTALTADSNTIFLSLNLNRFQYTDSTAAYTNISVTGTPSVVAFSPFNPTASWSAATYGGSGYFDGSGDYLNIANNSALGISSGNFTIEFWVNFNSVSSYPVLFDFRSAQPQAAPTIYLNNDSRFNYLFNSGTAVAFGPNPLVVGTWYHLAWVRSGTTHTIYVNGQSQTTFSDAAGVTSSALNIAARQAVSVQDYFNGYISDFRFVKGTAVYTGNFTPPTAPLTAITNTSLLLNFTNAGISDATSKNDLETVGNAQISTTQSKFGGSSMYFDGAGDYLNFPSSQLFGLGTGDFTIEFWLYLNTVSGTQNLCDFRNATATEAAITLYMNLASPRLYVNGADRITGGNLSTGQWYHVALTRSSTSTKLFVGGTQSGSTYTDPNNYLTPRPLRIGMTNDGTAQFPLNAYIQDFRVTLGYARYTANFTPPTAAFPTL